mgnify:CR=1 FL=1
MIKQFVMIVFGILVFSACSSNNNSCEDVTLASEQVQQCQSLHKQIINAKNKPLMRTELERRILPVNVTDFCYFNLPLIRQ